MQLTHSDIEGVTATLGVNPRAAALLQALISREGPASISEIVAAVSEPSRPVSRRQTQRYLKELLERGVIEIVGAGRTRRYRLVPQAFAAAYLAIDYLDRAPKAYDPRRLRDYEPNRSRFLPSAYAREMRGLSDRAIGPGATINEVIFQRIMIDTAWASSRLEGNTYTLGETEELLDSGREAPARTPYEAQMIRNHARAVEILVGQPQALDADVHTLRALHGVLSKDLLADEMQEGAIRRGVVQIGQSAYTPMADPFRLEEELHAIASKAAAIADPYEQSFFLLLMIPYLQPFIDVNKRVGRIAANIPLLAKGLCPNTYVGLDERAYVNGLLAFYEIGDTHTMAEAMLRSYRNDVERFRTYFHALGERSGIRRHYAGTIDRLVREVVRAIARDRIDADEWQMTMRRQLDASIDAAARDAIILEARNVMNGLDEAKALALGVKRDDYRCYIERRRREQPGV